MAGNGLELCGSGCGQVAGFCEHGNEHTANSLTNVELSASEEGLCSMEFVSLLVAQLIQLAGTQSAVP
jgi:hypothetical protein